MITAFIILFAVIVVAGILEWAFKMKADESMETAIFVVIIIAVLWAISN